MDSCFCCTVSLASPRAVELNQNGVYMACSSDMRMRTIGIFRAYVHRTIWKFISCEQHTIIIYNSRTAVPFMRGSLRLAPIIVTRWERISSSRSLRLQCHMTWLAARFACTPFSSFKIQFIVMFNMTSHWYCSLQSMTGISHSCTSSNIIILYLHGIFIIRFRYASTLSGAWPGCSNLRP